MTTRLIFWDVQHGHAAYVQTPYSKIAIDLGTGSYGTGETFSPLRHLRYTSNVDQLDAVVITHPHRDHIDDILSFDLLSPRTLCVPSHLTENDIRQGNQASAKEVIDKYLVIQRQYNEPTQTFGNPFLPANNGGADIRVFFPQSCARSNLNNHSSVVVLNYESSTVLIPGDNEPPSWNELLSNPEFVTAIAETDVLLAPHHGRESGFSAALFKQISPKVTIVSDGAYCDTSATARYSSRSTGWTIHRRNGVNEMRKCVTTRNDGVVVVDLGRNPDGDPFLSITID